MKNRIRMRHLRCFLELSTHQSVTQAAVALNTVQPSVSRTLKELEDVAGAILFQRSTSVNWHPKLTHHWRLKLPPLHWRIGSTNERLSIYKYPDDNLNRWGSFKRKFLT